MEGSDFKVGDLVRLKHSPQLRLHIIERLEQTCPGGTQVHYRCRAHGDRYAFREDGVRDYNCVEVAAIPESGELESLIRRAMDAALAMDRPELSVNLANCLKGVRDET